MKEALRLDIESIRARAKKEMESGALTDGYKANRDQVVAVLNEVLATEIVCTLRYKSHYHLAQGIKARTAAAEFLEHAQQESEHVDMVAERIAQLGGEPNFDPEGLLTRGHGDFGTAQDLKGMLEEDLIAERVAIESYSEIVRWLGEDDPTSRRMMETILATEEEHADDIADLLSELT